MKNKKRDLHYCFLLKPSGYLTCCLPLKLPATFLLNSSARFDFCGLVLFKNTCNARSSPTTFLSPIFFARLNTICFCSSLGRLKKPGPPKAPSLSGGTTFGPLPGFPRSRILNVEGFTRAFATLTFLPPRFAVNAFLVCPFRRTVSFAMLDFGHKDT